MSAYKSSPCFKCKDRYVGCHTVCRDYAEFKNELSVVSIEKNKDLIIKEYVLAAKQVK